MVEMLIVMAVIGMITAIAIPNFLKNREYVHKDLCIENLAHIEAAKQMWGIQHNKSNGAVVTIDDLVGPSLYFRVEPKCPSDGNYTYEPIGVVAKCDVPTHEIH
jgi:competence protein ComGC